MEFAFPAEGVRAELTSSQLELKGEEFEVKKAIFVARMMAKKKSQASSTSISELDEVSTLSVEIPPRMEHYHVRDTNVASASGTRSGAPSVTQSEATLAADRKSEQGEVLVDRSKAFTVESATEVSDTASALTLGNLVDVNNTPRGLLAEKVHEEEAIGTLQKRGLLQDADQLLKARSIASFENPDVTVTTEQALPKREAKDQRSRDSTASETALADSTLEQTSGSLGSEPLTPKGAPPEEGQGIKLEFLPTYATVVKAPMKLEPKILICPKALSTTPPKTYGEVVTVILEKYNTPIQDCSYVKLLTQYFTRRVDDDSDETCYTLKVYDPCCQLSENIRWILGVAPSLQDSKEDFMPIIWNLMGAQKGWSHSMCCSTIPAEKPAFQTNMHWLIYPGNWDRI